MVDQLIVKNELLLDHNLVKKRLLKKLFHLILQKSTI